MSPILFFVLFLDKELQLLRGENRKNMLLSVAVFAISALAYYAFFYNEVDTWHHPGPHKDWASPDGLIIGWLFTDKMIKTLKEAKNFCF